MRIRLLGTGTPTPSLRRMGSSYMVETGGDTILFDLGPGACHRMLEAGIIEEIGPKSLEGDARRRCYKVTPFGLRFAEAEATRLARLVAAARARNLLKQPEPAQ